MVSKVITHRAWRWIAASALTLGVIVGVPVSAQADGIEIISFESVNNSRVVLGELASRSQRNPVAISGIGPYTIRGVDSRSGDAYSFVTDRNYNPASTAGWARESDERALSGAGTFSSVTTSYAGRTGVLQLSQNTTCVEGNTFGGVTTFCSVFGPDVYTQAFTASEGQAVSFDWAAVAVSDDYEVYAYLVKVDGAGYGTATDHSLLAYGRGSSQGWTTASGLIPEDGTYRFRFVNGSYDASGGYALGSQMFIDSVVRLGLANPIAFDSIGDKIVGAPAFGVSATAPGGTVTFRSNTPSICTISSGQVSLTGSTGICTIVADQAGDGVDYVPAESTARSFRVLSAPTAPINAGLPYVTGTFADGSVVTVNDGTWTDGGAAITGTSYQWQVTNASTTTNIVGQTGAQCLLAASPGSQVRAVVTQTNSVGSTAASSLLQLSGYTCVAPVTPDLQTTGLGTVEKGVAIDVALVATGTPDPTYAVTAGLLPAGLTLNTTTGRVTGTPTTAGSYVFTVTVTNMAGTDSVEFTGTVVEPPGAIVGVLADWRVGIAVADDVSATGTPAPQYSISAGALPDGVVLDLVTGALTGNPTTAGEFTFTISASNGVGDAATREFTGTVVQAPTRPVPPTVGPIRMGVYFTLDLSVEASPPPTYSVVSGQLPAGLTLNPLTGVLSGTPTGTGEYSFQIAADNGIGDPLVLSFDEAVLANTGADVTKGAIASVSLLLAGLAMALWSRRERRL